MIRRKLARFVRYDFGEQLLHVEILFWVVLARLLIRVFSFKRVAKFLGRQGVESPQQRNASTKALERFSRVIERVARHVPFEARCLVQAIAAKLHLRTRGLSSTIYIGVAKNPGETMRSHAWLRHGDTILTGDEGLDQFKVIMVFG